MLERLQNLKTGQELKIMFEENDDYLLIRKDKSQKFLVSGKYTGRQGWKNLSEIIRIIPQ